MDAVEFNTLIELNMPYLEQVVKETKSYQARSGHIVAMTLGGIYIYYHYDTVNPNSCKYNFFMFNYFVDSLVKQFISDDFIIIRQYLKLALVTE